MQADLVLTFCSWAETIILMQLSQSSEHMFLFLMYDSYFRVIPLCLCFSYRGWDLHGLRETMVIIQTIHHDKIFLSGNVCSTRLVLLIIHSSSSLQMILEIRNYSSLLSSVITTTKYNLIRRQQGCILIVLINYAKTLYLRLGFCFKKSANSVKSCCSVANKTISNLSVHKKGDSNKNIPYFIR